MLEEIALLIICVFCGLIGLILAITTIVKRKEKSGLIALIFTLLAFAGAGYSGLTFVRKTFNTVKETGTKVKETSTKAVGKAANVVVEATAEVLSSRFPESAFMDSIKVAQPKGKAIPEPYYYCCGVQDNYRMPLIYPYSITVIKDEKYAAIEDETDVKNAFAGTKDAKPVIANVTEFLYNQLFLIGKQEQDSTTGYFILKFNTGGKPVVFDSKEDLAKYLDKNMGLGLPDKFFTPMEYYKRFW